MDYKNRVKDVLEYCLDPEQKVHGWLLTGTPYPVLMTLTVYLLVVLKVGPYFMKNRSPFQLHTTMRVYNFFQVVMNAFIFLRLLFDRRAMVALARTQCSLEDHDQYNKEKEIMLFYGWLYLILKILDLLDTVFMVLRKKDSHVTFLHVYHHSSMVFFVWLCFRYSKSHHGVIPAIINTSVHTVMYSYYLMATFPRLKDKLWWKKYLTTFQLGQFLTVLIYFSILYYFNCNIPEVFTYVWMFNVTVFCALFINFYVKAYLVDKAKVDNNHT